MKALATLLLGAALWRRAQARSISTLKRIQDAGTLTLGYRSDALGDLYGRWFGCLGQPGPMLTSMIDLNALAE